MSSKQVDVDVALCLVGLALLDDAGSHGRDIEVARGQVAGHVAIVAGVAVVAIVLCQGLVHAHLGIGVATVDQVALARVVGIGGGASQHGQRLGLVGSTLHLRDIPVGSQIAEVAHTCIRSHAFCILIIPEGEGVVVAIGEDNGVALLLKGHQVVLSEVTAAVTVGAVVVVPGLRGHLNRHKQGGHSDYCG